MPWKHDGGSERKVEVGLKRKSFMFTLLDLFLRDSFGENVNLRFLELLGNSWKFFVLRICFDRFCSEED